MTAERGLAWALLLATVACAGTAGYRRSDVPGVTVVPASDAPGTVHRVDALRDATDDDLVKAFLEEARSQGASVVSQLTLHEVGEREGRVQDCRRAFVPEGQTETRLALVPRFPPPQTRTTFRAVTRSEPASEYRCRTAYRTETRVETTYAYQYDYVTRSSRLVPCTRMVPVQVPYQDCRTEMVWRFVTRLEPISELYYPPAEHVWTPVAHTRWTLNPAAPVCVDAPGQAPGRWVDGALHP